MGAVDDDTIAILRIVCSHALTRGPVRCCLVFFEDGVVVAGCGIVDAKGVFGKLLVWQV